MTYRAEKNVCRERCLGSVPRVPLWAGSRSFISQHQLQKIQLDTRSVMLPHRGRIPTFSRGRQIMFGLGDELGFSLKPPKWLRKAQPGKILAKAAVPLAIGAGALLIPGVGGALVGAASGAGRLIGRGAVGAAKLIGSGFTKGIVPIGKAVMPTVGTAASNIVQPILNPTLTLPGATMSPNPNVNAQTYSGGGGSYSTDGGGGGGLAADAGDGGGGVAATPAQGAPSWLLPVGIGVAALVFGGMLGRSSK